MVQTINSNNSKLPFLGQKRFVFFLREGIVNSNHIIRFASPNVKQARVAQLVEHDLAKVGVAGSNPVSRSKGTDH